MIRKEYYGFYKSRTLQLSSMLKIIVALYLNHVCPDHDYIVTTFNSAWYLQLEPTVNLTEFG